MHDLRASFNVYLMHACFLHASIHTFHSVPFRSITLHSIAFHCITLHYITLHTLHARIHAYMHRCINAYIHACIHRYLPSYLPTHIHTYIHTIQYMNLFMFIQTFVRLMNIYKTYHCFLPFWLAMFPKKRPKRFAGFPGSLAAKNRGLNGAFMSWEEIVKFTSLIQPAMHHHNSRV